MARLLGNRLAGRPGSCAEASVGDEGISARDADELAACFAVHARELFGYACVIARGDRAQADDLVQASFEAAARAWWTLRCLTEDQRRGWLRKTLANIAVSGFRRDTAFRTRLARIEARYRKAEVDTAAQALSSITLEQCWRIINAMPRRQHAVALLRWQQDMKESEIAAVLGMAENTVSVHLHQARRKLIAQLGPDYPFADGDTEGER
jgi:RNA polymerase sigma-70 factor, ECF subfamily